MADNEKDVLLKMINQQRERPDSLPESAESRLVQDLEHGYHSYARANDDSLWRVQGRLEARLRRSQHHAKIIPLAHRHKRHERKHAMDDRSHARQSGWSRLSRVLSTTAALLVVTLIIGSAFMLFNNKKSTNTTTASATPIVSSPGIYMITLKDWYTDVVSKADSQTHRTIWEFSAPKLETSSLTIYGNTVYFSAGDGQTLAKSVYALDANTGKLRWKTDFGKSATVQHVPPTPGPGDSSTLTPTPGQDGVQSGDDLGYLTQPTVANGVVYVMARSGKVTALDANTGKVRWTYDSKVTAVVNGTIYDAGQLEISDGIVYGAIHNKLFALHADSGKEAWQPVQIDQDLIFNGVTVEGDVLYANSYIKSEHHSGMALDSYVYAFDAQKGTQTWSYHSQDWNTMVPVVSNGNVYFVGRQINGDNGDSHNTLYALNSKGKVIWQKGFDSSLSSPVVDNGLLYFSDSAYNHTNGSVLTYNLHALHTENGKEAWSKKIAADPVQVLNGVLYTRAGDRHIIAYDAMSGGELWRAQYGVDLVNKMGGQSAPAPIFTVVP